MYVHTTLHTCRVARWYTYFQTQNTNLGKFWRDMEWKRLVYSMAIWNISWPFLYILWAFGNLVTIWYVTPSVLVYCVKKSGNPAYMRVFAQQQQQQQCMLTSGKWLAHCTTATYAEQLNRRSRVRFPTGCTFGFKDFTYTLQSCFLYVT
jgi:hypothetical protein